MSISEKAQAMIDELVAACIAFGRGVEPDWQTRIEKAQRELAEYVDELEKDNDMLSRAVIAASKQSRKNTQTDTVVYGKEREE